MNDLKTALTELKSKGLRRHLRLVQGQQDRQIKIDGRMVLNFCSNNYLGLANHERLKQAAVDCIREEGIGSGASRLVCGNLTAHDKLEKKLAEFKGTEAALIFSTGYMANVGIIPSLFSRGDVVFADRLNHASIIDGILLSQAEFKRYPHKDMTALEEMLKAATGFRKRAIITDSIFSMDGDIAPLPDIVRLAQKYDCLVMVDEAHALGVLGPHGKGAVEHFGLEGKIDTCAAQYFNAPRSTNLPHYREKISIQMGTLSKAVGSFGAYCCGSQELIDYLINKARSFIYTTGLPPSVAAASVAGLKIIETEIWRREKLWANTRFLTAEFKRDGFDTLTTQTPIIPIVVKEADVAV